MLLFILSFFFLFKQKTAYEMRISDWSSDVCSSDLHDGVAGGASLRLPPRQPHRRPGGAAPRRRAERRPALDDGRGGHARGAAPGSRAAAPTDRQGGQPAGRNRDRKSTRLNSSNSCAYRMPPSACKKKTHVDDRL